jgi:succinate-semialdehyde dehydrogenase/glutarate-semialdehyde dehydrogenase
MESQLNSQLSNAGLLQCSAFIDGKWCDNSQGNTFSVLNPATEQVIAQVANLSMSETEQAIDAAKKAQVSWRRKSAKDRAHVLEYWYDLVIENTEDLALIMSTENGKSLQESRGEVAYSASFIKWFAEEAKRVYGDIVPLAQTDKRGMIIKQPVGVVAAITPWNFPSAMITRKVAPALAVGCAVVLKPAAETPLSALALAYLAQQAGLPAGLFNVVTGDDAKAIGGVLTSHPDVKKLTFTGSTPVGKLLMNQCSATVKRTSMELGGNAPLIIFDDADLDLVVPGIVNAKFRNSGQTCISANRILVQEGIYTQFIERLQSTISTFKFGSFSEQETTHGPMITQQAKTNLHAKVSQAVAQGATLLCGGSLSDEPGYFYPATVLTDLTTDMDIFRQEIFGPVAAIYQFSDQAQAVEMANDTEFGLAAYFYTENMRRSWQVSEDLEYGMVGVNETAIGAEMIPFGGVKESGQGREGSKYGLDDYLEIKYVCHGNIS